MATKEAVTNEAFRILVESPYYWSKTGLSNDRRRYFLHQLNKGGSLTLDKKEELLAQAGFTVKQEKTWNLPA